MPTRAFGVTAVAGLAAVVLPVTVGVPAGSAEPVPQTVSIRVELDLPYVGYSDGPKVFEVTDVPVGDGPELTGADEIADPSGWRGSLTVDIDNVDQTITIAPEEPFDFQTASVVVEGEGIDSLDVVSDTLWEPYGDCEMELVEADADDGVADIFWEINDADCDPGDSVDMNPEGAAVFSYGSATPITAPTTTTTAPTSTTAAPTSTTRAPAATGTVARPAFTG
jgi:hypothetical protein